MQHVLTASGSETVRALGTRIASRLGLAVHLVTSGVAALNAARRLKPRLAILDEGCPDLDGYELCRQIGADPELAAGRTMLVVENGVSEDKLARITEVGCDDAVLLPAPDTEVLAHAADLLGLPRRRGGQVSVELVIPAGAGGGTRTFRGTVEELTPSGIKVKLLESLGAVELARAWISRQSGGRVSVVDTRVVARHDDARTAELEFRNLTADARGELESLWLWEVVNEEDLQRVYLQGDLSERTDFRGLAKRLSRCVDFDAAGVRYINSHGSRLWLAFLRSLDEVREYTFSRCSIAFTAQASLLRGFTGRGRILSLKVPYRCEACERDDPRLLQTALLVGQGVPELPRLRCPQCSGRLALDELPEHYFAFRQGS